MSTKQKNIVVASLRHNISIDSDVDLAMAELLAVCGLKGAKFVKPIVSSKELQHRLKDLGASDIETRFMSARHRSSGIVAIEAAVGGIDAFHDLLLRSAFLQEVIYFGEVDGSLDAPRIVAALARNFVTGGGTSGAKGVTLSALLDYSTKMVSDRDKGHNVGTSLDSTLAFLLDEVEPPRTIQSSIKSAILAKKTSLYLTHELHLYKGKFFPRLIRSLINRFAPGPNSLVADPFVGSGTLLLDAALLGHRSIGVDVDPTSTLISKEKLSPASIDPVLMYEVCMSISDAAKGDHPSLFSSDGYNLAGWQKFLVEAPEPMRSRLRKRGLEEGYDLLGEVENDAAKALCLIAQAPTEVRSLLRVCLSHALTKKLRLRFVGIGNGRFTIDVAKVGVLELFVKKAFHMVAMTETFSWLREKGLGLGETTVVRGSAKDFATILGNQRVDLVITSPPYIPASSGREHYARARAIPLVFTGAATVEELDVLDAAFIGEMSATHDTQHLEQSMPTSIRRTLEFLRNDAQRLPKYLPTLNYYVDLRKVLESTFECLADGGKALFVVATSHTFYIHKTKEILHTVNAAEAMADLGLQVGFKLVEVISVPLLKSGGLNARPRSVDEYSESVVVFSKPSSSSEQMRAIEHTAMSLA